MKEITISENAVKNHGELSQNHESKLQRTDPEFIELFDNWAFDEVIRQSKLDTRTRVLIILASTIASQALGEYCQADLLWRATLKRAAELSREHSRSLGTRSLDVLHVASAMELGLRSFITFDVRQQNLVEAVGLKLLVPTG